jgi:hypothetical protein
MGMSQPIVNPIQGFQIKKDPTAHQKTAAILRITADARGMDTHLLLLVRISHYASTVHHISVMTVVADRMQWIYHLLEILLSIYGMQSVLPNGIIIGHVLAQAPARKALPKRQ